MNSDEFFKVINNGVFENTMENVRKYKDSKLVTTERRRNYSVSEPNYQTTKFFRETLLATQVLIKKPEYLGLSVLDLSKTLMYEFRDDYLKPKYGENVKLCNMDTDSLIVPVKADDIYKDIAKDVETRFDTSNFGIDQLLL